MRKDIQKLAEIMEIAERNGNKEPKPEIVSAAAEREKLLPNWKRNLPVQPVVNAADANSTEQS